jgi:membrane protein implicated in regulation of membrane protease activity
MSWINTHLTESLIILGFALLAIEILILGFSTFILFFIGIAAILSGGIFFIGLMEATMVNAMLLVGLMTVISAILLWKPLKNMQKDVDVTPAKSDLIGHQFVLNGNVSADESPNYRYSGIEWTLKSDVELAAGTKVEVTTTDVGIFHIKEVE